MSTTNLIDYSEDSCDCSDWPRVWLCKHIATIAHFCTEETKAPNPTAQVHECSHSDSSPVPNASTVPILEKMISVSRDYISNSLPSSPETVWRLQLVESHLIAMIHSTLDLSKTCFQVMKVSCPINRPGPRLLSKWEWSTERGLGPLTHCHLPQPPSRLDHSIRSNHVLRMPISTVVASGLARMLIQTPRPPLRMPRHVPTMQVLLPPNGATSALAHLHFPHLQCPSCWCLPYSCSPPLPPPPLHDTQCSPLITQVHSCIHQFMHQFL